MVEGGCAVRKMLRPELQHAQLVAEHLRDVEALESRWDAVERDDATMQRRVAVDVFRGTDSIHKELAANAYGDPVVEAVVFDLFERLDDLRFAICVGVFGISPKQVPPLAERMH